jgi:tartrate-resistant acid phosphatase type 5
MNQTTSSCIRSAMLGMSALMLVACGVSQPPATSTPTPPDNPNPPSEAPKVRFVAFGDAGRANANQTAVGAAMAQLCQLKGCDFALELGDNFYDSGVSSTTDAQWQTKFEVPYKDLNIPVYATLGNHDNSQTSVGEGGANSKGNFQVDYTTVTGPGVSGKWKMPARYYSFTAPLNPIGGAEPIAEFFSLDSSPLAATLANPAEVSYNAATYGPTQMQWFQQALTNSKAKWTFAFAHHPYVSNGQHGNAGEFEGAPSPPDPLPPAFPFATTSGKPWKDMLDNSMCSIGLDMFIFGHDHDLEWLKPVPSCNDKTEFILSGAASDVREFGDEARNPTYWQQDLMQGFFWFEVSADTLVGESYVLEDGLLPISTKGLPVPAFTRTLNK